MSVTRRVPTPWFGAGVMLGLGFVLGLLASGVLAQLSGGPGSPAQAAEAAPQTPTPGPTPVPATPNGTSPAPTSSTSPAPTAPPVETPEGDDDGPALLESGATPRSPRTPRSAQGTHAPSEDANTLEGPGGQLIAATPGGATAEDLSAAQTVIQGPVYVTIIYKDRIDIDFEQDAEGESGDALAASQVIGAVTTGNANIDGRNSSGGSGGAIAESGAALAANSIEVTGPFVQGGIDWSNVAIAGPVSWSVVFEDDVKLKFKQKGQAASGSALADSQLFGINARGDVNLGAWNNAMGGGGGGDSSARSGDATVDNNIDIRSPLIVGDFVLNGSTLNGDLVQTVSYLDDVKVKFKQTFLSLSGLSAAASQYLDEFNAGGDVDATLDNNGTGSSRSGDSGGSNVADAGPNTGPTSSRTTPPASSDEPSGAPQPEPEEEPARVAAAPAPDAAPASATLSGAWIAQALLVAAALAFGLGRRRRT